MKTIKAKQEHKTKWNNPQMYLTKGILGPHYLLYKFKATDSLDTANLKVLKIAGTLKYKVGSTNNVKCCMSHTGERATSNIRTRKENCD